MNFQPLIDAGFAVQLHVLTVLIAMVLTLPILLMRKGTRLHKALGAVWMGSVFVASISTFFIHEVDMFMGFSPIHLLSIFVLFSLYRGLRAALRGDGQAHRAAMLGIVIGGFLIAGAFTFWPGRIMYEVFLG